MAESDLEADGIVEIATDNRPPDCDEITVKEANWLLRVDLEILCAATDRGAVGAVKIDKEDVSSLIDQQLNVLTGDDT